MKLPQDWMIYSRLIDERCRNLIDYNIWNGISLNRYNLWLNNFITDEEKYLAARILDSLIYRSDDQTKSMMYDNLYRNINNVLRKYPLNSVDTSNFPNSLRDKWNDPLIRIVPVLRRNDPPTKSAHLIARMIDREFKVQGKYIINPNETMDAYNQSGVKIFIFIDDFAGTGKTFCEAYEECEIKEKDDINSIFAPLTAHTESIKNIKKKFPKVRICSSEELTEEHSFFKYSFGDDDKSANEMKIFYKNFVNNKMKVDKKFKHGFGELELLYSFQHACPNNSLPLLYHEVNWNPLFKR